MPEVYVYNTQKFSSY